MKLRKALGTVVGAVGTMAATNRVLQSRADGFEPMLAGDQGTYRWRGFDVAYTEAGDPSDPDLVLCHGINAAASNHEFRAVFDTLAEEYHVIAPDLPGFGHTDRPPLVYSASLFTAFVRDFIADNTTDATVVASSLTGAYAASAAQNVDVQDLILICPTDNSMGSRTVWLRSLLRSPVIGEALYNLTVSKPSIRHFHADHGYYNMDNLSAEVVDYEWQSGHQPGARFAPASFVTGFLDPEDDLGEVLGSLNVPVTLVWGEDIETTPLSEGRELAEQADAMLVVFGDSLLLPHVEHPGEFVDVVQDNVTSVTVEE
ncbi:MAG: alpha/beta fold hydrolase [Haloarcula sp.]